MSFLLTVPQTFHIVECTDCSVKLKWCKNESDHFLEYTFVYPPEGSDDWNRLHLTARGVSTEDHRCCVYTLKELSPDTGYEVKIRCFNNLVKSRYTEYKTTQNLTKLVRWSFLDIFRGMIF